MKISQYENNQIIFWFLWKNLKLKVFIENHSFSIYEWLNNSVEIYLFNVWNMGERKNFLESS